MEIQAPPGNYTLERSVNLSQGSWQSVGPIVPNVEFGSLTDAAALALPAAFYRVAGGFQETEMRSISFASTISSSGNPQSGILGGLWTGNSQDSLRLQSANPQSALIKSQAGERARFRVEPTSSFGQISAYVERWNDEETLPLTINGGRLNLTHEEGNLELFQLEGGNHSIFGIGQYADETTETGEFGTYLNSERGTEAIWAIAKSVNANPADLAGDWGFVRVLVNAEQAGLLSNGWFNVEAWHTTITAGPNPRPFAVSSFMDVDVQHQWPSGQVVTQFRPLVVHSPVVSVSLSLSPNGEVTIQPEESDTLFRGMVSPSAKLMVLASSVPDSSDLPAAPSERFDSNLNQAVSEWAVGVKKTSSPQLAGKTYRILRQGWWMDGPTFKINASNAGERVVFNSNGSSATCSFDSQIQTVQFDGGITQSTHSGTLPMSVSVDAAGRILLEGSIPGESTIRTFGYAQEGSNLLVMVESVESTDGSAGLGLLIAVPEP